MATNSTTNRARRLDALQVRPAAADTETMTIRRTLLTLAAAAALMTPAPALAAAPATGSWKGKIAYQGYEITFKVKNGRMTNVAARLLADCDRDGYTESMTLAPSGSFPIRNGRVQAKVKDRYDASTANYELNVRFNGASATGWIREWDFVEGNGVVCDTLKRDFTAKRGG
jgi:hypothetical protein